eukprot:s2696_g3.t1
MPGDNGGSSAKKSRFSKLLQVGTLPACTCFGCHEVVTGMKWPFSLVAETVAEVYTISKQDLLRTVAKKLLASLVEISREMQYSDAWLLHLNRQTERWDAYKEDMIKKAVEDVRDASEATEARGQGDDLEAGPGGTHPKDSSARPRVPFLTQREEEFYSDSPATLLRRIKTMRKDRHLMKVLETKGGYKFQKQVKQAGGNATSYLTLGDFSTRRYATPSRGEQDWDPSMFLVKHWSAVSQEQRGLGDIDVTHLAKEMQAYRRQSRVSGRTSLSLGEDDQRTCDALNTMSQRRMSRRLSCRSQSPAQVARSVRPQPPAPSATRSPRPPARPREQRKQWRRFATKDLQRGGRVHLHSAPLKLPRLGRKIGVSAFLSDLAFSSGIDEEGGHLKGAELLS